ncbi:hypothetical protein [Pseudorhodoferax sp.]|uniref:hypothetical protein n=1 Tax=Pseudorhodoferax sp. TaxID=1993553 RepID=UPI0039E495D7
MLNRLTRSLAAVAVFALWSLGLANSAAAAVLEVGPGRAYTSIGAAARAAKDGDTVQVRAGEYRADVAVWTQRRLDIRAVGGRARLVANGAYAEGKGIWVVRGGDIRVQGFDFVGARVPDRNGAGIRFERGQLTVVDCLFEDNENGILTGADPLAELAIERSVFRSNGAGDGYSHNLYVGRIARLTVKNSEFRDARVGHLLKSRAAATDIRDSQFVDSDAGQTSYQLEFPNGGVVTVSGSRVRQGPATSNSTMVSYGAEGYNWPTNELVMRNNTLVDDRPSNGVYLRVRAGDRKVVLEGNRLEGTSRTRAKVLTY